jgi:hypothetical protein
MATNNNVDKNINNTPVSTKQNNTAVLQTLVTFNSKKVHWIQKADEMGDYLKNKLQQENLIESKRRLYELKEKAMERKYQFRKEKQKRRDKRKESREKKNDRMFQANLQANMLVMIASILKPGDTLAVLPTNSPNLEPITYASSSSLSDESDSSLDDSTSSSSTITDNDNKHSSKNKKKENKGHLKNNYLDSDSEYKKKPKKKRSIAKKGKKKVTNGNIWKSNRN